MKPLKLIAFLIAFFATTSANAKTQIYKIDTYHAHVGWKINHSGFSNTLGQFGGISGFIWINEKNPSKSKVQANIDVSSVTSDLKALDDNIKNEEFLNTTKFQEAKFVSTKIEMTSNITAKIYGKFTLKGITKEVILDAKLNKKGLHPLTKQETVGFSATASINRSDFDVGSKYPAPIIGEEIELQIELEAVLN